MDTLPKIIVLDDEAELRNMLQRFLGSHGFEVRVVDDSKRLDRYLQREPFDLLVLDLMMEPEDGLSVCRRLRAEGQTLPILMLTAKGDPRRQGDRPRNRRRRLPRQALPAAANSSRACDALLRRQKIAAGDPTLTSQIDPLRRIPARSRQAAALSQRRAVRDPLRADAVADRARRRRRTAPVSRDNLIARTRGRDHDALDRSIDVQVLRLRQIVEADPSKPRFIKTVWGVGYMLLADIES